MIQHIYSHIKRILNKYQYHSEVGLRKYHDIISGTFFAKSLKLSFVRWYESPGEAVALILSDMTNHADATNQTSLLCQIVEKGDAL